MQITHYIIFEKKTAIGWSNNQSSFGRRQAVSLLWYTEILNTLQNLTIVC